MDTQNRHHSIYDTRAILAAAEFRPEYAYGVVSVAGFETNNGCIDAPEAIPAGSTRRVQGCNEVFEMSTRVYRA